MVATMMMSNIMLPRAARPLKAGVRIVLAMIFAALAYWWIAYPDYSWRQKMTIEVEAAGQIFTGSSVAEVVSRNNYFNARYATAPPWRQEIRGEAPFVTLPDGRTIFALLSSANDLEYTGNIAGRSLLNRQGRVWGHDELKAIVRSDEVMVLPAENYPLLVTFTDINDPTSVRRVDPGNLAATFGPGVSLKQITLEITDDAATTGPIESLLPWLETVGRERSTLVPNPPRLQKDAADPAIQYLTPGSFSTELYN
jgi:hypothetical protein